MKLAEIKASSNEELISALYWIAVRATKEANTKRGLTKQTTKQEQQILDELTKRLNLDADKLQKLIDRQ